MNEAFITIYVASVIGCAWGVFCLLRSDSYGLAIGGGKRLDAGIAIFLVGFGFFPVINTAIALWVMSWDTKA